MFRQPWREWRMTIVVPTGKVVPENHAHLVQHHLPQSQKHNRPKDYRHGCHPFYRLPNEPNEYHSSEKKAENFCNGYF